MFVSYKWLEDYVDLQGIDPAVLAEKITRAGIEVEGIEYKGEGVKGVVIGHVLEREQHPNADKLNKCLVDIGAEASAPISTRHLLSLSAFGCCSRSSTCPMTTPFTPSPLYSIPSTSIPALVIFSASTAGSIPCKST